MDCLENSKSHISMSLKLLKIHKITYLCGVNGDRLKDHIMSLKHGLTFLESFLEVSENENLKQRIQYLVSYVKQKLYLIRYLKEDESLVAKLDHAYADLREEMKNVIIKPGTNEFDVIFPEIFTRWYYFNDTSSFLCKKIKKLLNSGCKVDQITPMMKELEDMRKMITSLLEPFFEYARDAYNVFTEKEEEKVIFSTVTSVLGRATCFIYFSFVEKMDDKMVLQLKNNLSDLIIEETQIMKMYLSLDVDSVENIKSHISMSLRLLKWNKNCYLGMVMGATLEDHFMSIKHGLQFLVMILEFFNISRDIDLKQRIQHLVAIVKRKIYSLPHNQEDENLVVNLEHAYGELREEMQNVVINQGTDYYETLFSENIHDLCSLRRTKDFLLEKIRKLVTSGYKADQIAPMMEELEELRKKLASLDSFFYYVKLVPDPYALKEEEKNIFSAVTTFLDRATCLIYLSYVAKLNKDMVFSVWKALSLLIEETDIKDMSLVLGVLFEEDFKTDMDISLSLLKRQEEYHRGTINEAILKDHILSLKHGIEFLKWLPQIYFDSDLEKRIIMLARNVKKKLESLIYTRWGVSLNHTYGALRKELENVIINPSTNKYYTIFTEFSPNYHGYRGDDGFLLDNITTLVSSNCKAKQIAPVMKELQDFRKMLTFFKPLSHYFGCELDWWCNGDYQKILTTLLTIHHKATLLIYLSFVGKMDKEMVLSVKSNISTSIKENDIWEIYTIFLNEVLFGREYLEEELYLLENLILLLKSNAESLNDASYKLYELLIDIHSFLLGLSPNALLRELQPSFNDILGHSIPIVCSCYLEHTEVDILVELNCVIDLIKRIKSEAQEIKLYYFPSADDLGFLEFFSAYLEDLMENPKLSIKEEIDALHFEVHSLLTKVADQEELHEIPWTDIIIMAYQAEYIVDLYLVSSSRDVRLISSLSKIIEKVKNIREDVHDLCCKSLSTQHVAVTSKPQVFGTTTQVMDTDAIVGFQEEAIIITEYILRGEEDKLDVISIVGMAGVGKTTLASTLYKTPSMADHFDILAWCTVSQSYQYRNLLLSILDQVNTSDKSHRSISDDEELADHFCRCLKQRRYLIVLDDIWDSTLWNYLKRYLPDGQGNRILITTRNRDAADDIGSKVNELHRLSEENSWKLFQKKMPEKESLSEDLLKISKGIIEDCQGLPLSIVIIAGILTDIERTEKTWNQIAENVSSFVLSDTQGKCKAILELSFNHLPSHLRSCYLYLGSFLEDEEIPVDRLIMRWVGEGFVRDTKSDRAEELAKKYIDVLVGRSLVIASKERSRGGVKTVRLHDLLLDFCLQKSNEKSFFMLFDKRNYSRPSQDPRRLIMNVPHMYCLDLSCHNIRSIICYSEFKASEIEKGIAPCDVVLLKVLEIGVSSKFFPNLSSFVHLSYLAMSLPNWSNRVLPSSISKLQNLQILILRCSYSEIKVPDFIWDLVKLRHVHIGYQATFGVDSNRLQNSSFLLENLRSLSKARVSCGDSKWLSKLWGLETLRCVFEEDDNQFLNLSSNGNLTCLKVQNAAGSEQRFLSTFQLPINLRELTLMEFFHTSNDISEIGRALPHLEVFKIYSFSVPSEYEWIVTDEDFPVLKVLKVRGLKISKWIASEYSFPSLEQLWLEECKYLDEIPLDFGYLLKLRLISVNKCAPSVDNSAREIEKLQHEDQNYEMRVHIYPRKG